MLNQNNHVRIWLTISAAIIFVLPACVSVSNVETHADTTGIGLVDSLPPPPQESVLDRIPSVIAQSVKEGMDTWANSNNVTVNGSHLEITAASGQLEYAIYRHNVGFETSLNELWLEMSVVGGEGGWIAIGDYGTGLWQLSGPFTSNQVIPVNLGNYLSSGGLNFFVAVIAYDGATVDLASTTLLYDSGVAPPSTYVDTMGAIFDANCMPCHSAGNATSGIILDSYWRANENAAPALAKILADHAPSGSGSMTPEEKDSFQSWVDNGKLYGQPVTFNSNIQPLTQNRCSPCHVGGGNSGGANFDTYANAFSNGDAAWARIRINSMPQSGGPLTDAQKDEWLAWIEQGKPE